MRVITGKYKGRNIAMPVGIRPTQSKVRKAIFDILGDIADLSFLELFAGSGAVGFEALSRGVAELTLVEDSRNALKEIRRNIESLSLTSCNLYPFVAEKAIRLLYKDRLKFDIIFIDPPYYKNLVPRPYDKLNKRGSGSTGNLQEEPLSKKTLQMLGGYDILAPNGLLIIQHFKKDILPSKAGDLKLFRESKYGDTALSFYRK